MRALFSDQRPDRALATIAPVMIEDPRPGNFAVAVAASIYCSEPILEAGRSRSASGPIRKAAPLPASTTIATILAGKNKPTYTPFLDTGDHVIVINAEKIRTTGMKSEQKLYQHYTGYPGGLRTEEYKKRMVRKPEAVIEAAVKRMLPKNKLAAHMLSKLNVYKGDKHPHQAQKPQDLKLEVREYRPRKVAVS